jgi:hypothetical protein
MSHLANTPFKGLFHPRLAKTPLTVPALLSLNRPPPASTDGDLVLRLGISPSFERSTLTSPVTTPGYHRGRSAPDRGRPFSAEVPVPDEVKALIRACFNRAPTGR